MNGWANGLAVLGRYARTRITAMTLAAEQEGGAAAANTPLIASR